MAPEGTRRTGRGRSVFAMPRSRVLIDYTVALRPKRLNPPCHSPRCPDGGRGLLVSLLMKALILVGAWWIWPVEDTDYRCANQQMRDHPLLP